MSQSSLPFPATVQPSSSSNLVVCFWSLNLQKKSSFEVSGEIVCRFRFPIQPSCLIHAGMYLLRLTIMIHCKFKKLHRCLKKQREGVFIWTDCLGGPHPPFELSKTFILSHFDMNRQNPISHTLTEIMQKLQHFDIINNEEDFLVINLEASVEESKNSCFWKILVEKEINIQNV